MRLLGFYWGITGVLGILLYAILRLAPKVLTMTEHALTPLQWGSLIVFVLYMAHAEGYKGFYLNFAPRVVARANCLRLQYSNDLNSPVSGFLPILFAPLFCMGYFYATRKRMITSFLVTAGIVCLVQVVGLLSQPWRGIIDAGVVVGLGIGVCSILGFWSQIERSTWDHSISVDLPNS